MEHFRGKVMDGEKVILDNATGHIRHANSGAISRWHGEIALPAGAALGPGIYTLKLEDGRQGEVQVVYGQYVAHVRRRVEFKGNGLLQ